MSEIARPMTWRPRRTVRPRIALPLRITLLLCGWALGVACSPALFADEPGYPVPETIQVMPVLFVPRDESVTSQADQALILKHLAWTRQRYGELLGGDTFEIARPTFELIRGEKPLDFYRNQPEGGAPDIVVEVLRHFKRTRFNNPYVFCIAFGNSRDGFPAGGGRPINGGFNTGGGMMYIATSEVHRNRRYQATLQHELGHAFGLSHPNAYGYDIQTNRSIMSYSEANYTDGFQPSPTPGILIPEDRRGLAMNDRVFRKTTFSPARDIPVTTTISPRIATLGPMTLPGQPDFYPVVTTDAGEILGSKVVNVAGGEIKPSAGPGITYDPGNMWHSDRDLKTPATLDFEFPFEIEATGLAIHSQHSGLDHAVTAMELLARDEPPKKKPSKSTAAKKGTPERTSSTKGKAPRSGPVPAEGEGKGEGEYRSLIRQPVSKVDDEVTFEKTRARRWRLVLEPGPSRTLVIRGIRFLNGGREVIPRQVPYTPSAPAAPVEGTAK